MRRALGILLATSLGTAALAHEHSRPDLDAWFQSLESGNGPCCDGPGKDATHLEDPDWRVVTEGGSSHYEVRRNGRWEVVPDKAVLRQPNRCGKALIWYGAWDKNLIRCFMPGTMS